jgi:phage-related tail protein
MAFNLAGKLDSSFRSMTSTASQRLQKVQSRIRELGQGQQRIEKFQNLKRQLEGTRKEYEEAQGEVKRLAQEIEASNEPTKEQQRAFERAKNKSQQLRRSLDSQQNQLQELRTEMREAGQSTRNLAQQQQELAQKTRLAQRRAEGWSRVANSNVAGSARNAAANVGTLARNASIASGVLGATAGYVVHNYARGAVETQKWAERLGLATTKLSELQHVGRQFDVQQGAVIDGLKEMSMRADEFAQKGAGPGADAFKRLGLSQSEIQRVKGDTDALFQLISKRMSGVQDVAARQRIADELLGGQGGEQMVQMLSASNEKIRQMRRQAHAVGNIIGEDEGKKAWNFVRAMNAARGAMKGVQKTIVSEILPKLTKALKSFTTWVKENQKRIEQFAKNFSRKFGEALPKILNLARGVANITGKMGSLIGKTAELMGGFRNLGIAIGVAFGAKTLISVAQLSGSLFSMGRGLVQVLSSMNLVSGATKAWTAAQWALNAAMNANPIALAATAAVGLGTAAYYVIRNWDKVKSWFTGFWNWVTSFNLFEVGKKLVTTLASGITSVASKVYKSVKNALGWVGNLLPGSDAKEGPLSKLTRAGQAIPQTMAKGVQKAGPQLQQTASRAMGVAAPAPSGPAPAMAGGPAMNAVQPSAGGGPGRGPVTLYVTNNISLEGSGEPETEIRRAGDEAAKQTKREVESYFSEQMRLGYH